MRRFLFILVISSMLIGCKSSDSFKHYTLKNADYVSYEYYGERNKETYVLYDITPDDYESTLTGLFLKLKDDDYILIETLESSLKDAYKSKLLYYFDDDKLYGIGNGDTSKSFIIELKGKNSKLKEIEYKYNNQTILPSSIKTITDDYIEISGLIIIEQHSLSEDFKCDKETYECDIK